MRGTKLTPAEFITLCEQAEYDSFLCETDSNIWASVRLHFDSVRRLIAPVSIVFFNRDDRRIPKDCISFSCIKQITKNLVGRESTVFSITCGFDDRDDMDEIYKVIAHHAKR